MAQQPVTGSDHGRLFGGARCENVSQSQADRRWHVAAFHGCELVVPLKGRPPAQWNAMPCHVAAEGSRSERGKISSAGVLGVGLCPRAHRNY